MNNRKVRMALRARLSFQLLLVVTVLAGCGKSAAAQAEADEQTHDQAMPGATVERPLIGGIPQGIVIRGSRSDNPVLLYVHGGPGRPVYPTLHDREPWRQLESLFTIAYWDQRGTGMSNPADLDLSTLNLDRLVEDAAEVAGFLKARFGKEKIYLLGHSWGSMLGSFTVQRHPELFHAYIGVGQAGNQAESERETLAWLQENATKRVDKDTLHKLSGLHLPQGLDAQAWIDYLVVNRALVSQYRGAWYTGAFSNEDYTRVMASLPHYTEREHKHNIETFIATLLQLWPTFVGTDLNTAVSEQTVPVYIFQGTQDYQTTYRQAKIYFDNLRAPEKRFYTFTQAAHWPHIEQYDDFERIVKRDILMMTDPASATID